MAGKCPNCKACISCSGAKIKTASNGATVCSFCMASYETQLSNGTPSTPQGYSPLRGNARAPIINKIQRLN
jgi:hypothetical protein